MLLFEENGTFLPDFQAIPAPFLPQGDLPVHVISLRRSTERRRRVAAQLAAASVAFSFLDAVDGSKLPGDRRAWVSPLSKLLKGHSFTAGQIGCWLSHRMVWQAVAEQPGSVALVLEDDAVLPPNFLAELRGIEAATRGFDLVQLSYTATSDKVVRGFRVIGAAGEHHAIGRLRGKINGGGAYLVRSAGAEKLLSIGSMAFCNDDWAWYEALTGLTRCGVWPPLVVNRTDDSVIAAVDAERGASRKDRKKKLSLRLHKLVLVPVLDVLRRAVIARRSGPLPATMLSSGGLA